jgi:hypothetical protein
MRWKHLLEQETSLGHMRKAGGYEPWLQGAATNADHCQWIDIAA